MNTPTLTTARLLLRAFTEEDAELDKACWGQGLATEAALASLQFGFGTLGLECIIGIVHPENEASIRVIEKIGMSLVDRNTYFGMEVYRYSKTNQRSSSAQ